MGRLANSWETVKASWEVLRKDKELLFLPVLSGIASAIILASFLAGSWFSGLLDRAVEQDEPNAQQILALLYFLMYLILTFFTVYFNSALIFAANQRLSGGDPTVGSALRGANARLGRILAWSLFAGTVSLIIHLLERATRGRNQWLSHLLVQLVGAAWTLATYFAVPVLVFENRGVFASLKRSAQLFRQRWGESLVGEYGIGLVFGLAALAVFMTTFLLVNALAALGPVALAVLVMGLLVFAFVIITGTALGVVYKAALYRFAMQGDVAPGFDPRLVRDAYRPT